MFTSNGVRMLLVGSRQVELRETQVLREAPVWFSDWLALAVDSAMVDSLEPVRSACK